MDAALACTKTTRLCDMQDLESLHLQNFLRLHGILNRLYSLNSSRRQLVWTSENVALAAAPSSQHGNTTKNATTTTTHTPTEAASHTLKPKDLVASISRQSAANSSNVIDAEDATDLEGMSTNVTAVSTNVTSVSTNVPGVSTNVTSVSTNVPGVSTNVTSVSTNVTDVSTNVTSVSTNVPGVSTNVTDVSRNAIVLTPTTMGLVICCQHISNPASVLSAPLLPSSSCDDV
eukprot:Blabericola_migrator_1__11240@NODE_660_length_7013_cov_22_730636_g482_i0_p2_GENE_NODE_660_length_7013_cov_22_730636_g482_i0NODE_660_length_7013_cov_22_730636_g482_i0_p2_ORF_typecomplete_len231_score53_45NPV_P10/PF05531_12/0_0054DUF1664/PF07889_12/4_6DUF1664/PF07889_12/0_27MCPsignal/PF00015_21/2_9e02MCPsignal/PF00015_21/0_029FlaC_arch/PF05377_11/28FlaC_arch/PF05377_11/3Talin_middle/PF09141_10/3_5Talin_middle/PF09141_10/3BORCS6/PF10157_9/31BORCS6/PF10157_9/20_NODE_660_length_7013_cov_22_730636_g48